MAALKIAENIQGKVADLKLAGAIDEDAIFPNVDFSTFSEINFDFNGVTSINSCGIREWIKWISSIPGHAKVSYSNCPKVIIDQVNMVEGFIPASGQILSFYIPYYCENCENVETKLFTDPASIAKGTLKVPANIKCSKCASDSEIDIIENKYFKFLKR